MGIVLTNIGSARRSIRNVWQKVGLNSKQKSVGRLQDLFYFRSNHPFFILISIAIVVALYNTWWQNAPVSMNPTTNRSTINIFDNFKLSKHKFVRMMICIPPDVVDYRFSTVSDAIHLTHLDYPELEFTKDIDKARKRLGSGEIDILILFKTLIETGRKIHYNIISPNGDLNKHYCIHCDNQRKQTWGNAVEAQVIVNRFLYWLARSRGFVHRKPQWHLSNIYIKGTDNDEMYSKRQTDLFIAWILLLPICSRLIDLWNDDRESGFYRTLLSVRVRRYEYFIAKFVFWYGISLVISCLVLIVNISVVSNAFTPTYIPFVVCYVASIITFTIFLATLFPGTPFFAKFVGLLLMASGEFGFGTVYHGISFFQLSVRFFGKSDGDGYWIDAICLLCMTINCILMISISIYLDTLFFSYTQQPLNFYFPLERAYWIPVSRGPLVDKYFVNQILQSKVEKNEVTVKKEIELQSPAKNNSPPKEGSNSPSAKKIQNIPLIVLYGVCKRVNNHWRVNQLSMTIRLGEIVTLYGHHGCGSEEVLSIISGQMKPEYGEIMFEQSQRPLMISMTTDVPCINYMTVTHYLQFISRMRGISLQAQMLTDIFDTLDLQKVQNRTLDLLSTTQKERLRIAAVFVGQPDIVLIDWPTKESLPEWKYMILRFIEKRKEKKSIIISSYDAEETESISDKVVLLSEGYVVLNGTCETYKQSMNSVFEIRLWPLNGFTDEQISGMITAVTLGDQQMRKDAKFFETPNGKIRITLPVRYRRSIPLILRELESVAAQYQIAFYELSKPNVHDIYTNSCYEPRQYEPLANYDQLKEYYAKQETISRTAHFFKNLVRILKDRQFLYQVAAVVGLFLVLSILTFISYHGTDRHFTHEITLDANDAPITIYCDECRKKTSEKVTFSKRSRALQLLDNQAVLYWKKNTAKGELELFSVSRGDVTFTMIIQNFAISQMFARITGHYPDIKPTLESTEFRQSSAKHGYSWIFNDVNTNQAAMILSESYSLMYQLGVFQTFVYTLSAVLPLRLVSVNMKPDSMLFPWPRYLYFGLIFAANLAVFLVITLSLISVTVAFGAFPEDTGGCFFHLFGAWFLSYASTLPLIYLLVFSVQNSMAVIPTVMAVSSLLVNLPNMVSSFSAENQISLQYLIKFVSGICVLSPPTSLQVLAAFLNVGEFHADNRGTITALTLLCGAQFWTLIVFCVCVFQPGFSFIRQYWFSCSTYLWSNFELGTTMKPGAALKNKYRFGQNNVNQTVEVAEKQSNTELPSRSVAAGDEDSKLSSDYIAGNSTSHECMSYITNYEEHVVEKLATMKKWNERQEVPVDNSATFLLGDQSRLKSALLKTIAETNPKEQIAYVPYVECLPTVYTPRELLENVAACHGYNVTEDHINYLLNTFGMKSLASTPINILTDADRRILMLLTKLVIKPTIIIIDQLEMFLPHPKMMTVWALCARLRADGVGIIFTSHGSFAEHTATSCAHLHKCSFISTLPPSTIKTQMGFTILEVVPKAEEKPEALLKMLQFSMKDATQMPSTSNNITLILNKDDVETIEMVLGVIRALSGKILRYSLRSGNFDEFLASTLAK